MKTKVKPCFVAVVKECLAASNSLEKCLRILAFVLQAQVKEERCHVKEQLTVQFLAKARVLINIVAAMEI